MQPASQCPDLPRVSYFDKHSSAVWHARILVLPEHPLADNPLELRKRHGRVRKPSPAVPVGESIVFPGSLRPCSEDIVHGSRVKLEPFDGLCFDYSRGVTDRL